MYGDAKHLVSVKAKIDETNNRSQASVLLKDLIKHIPYKVYTESYGNLSFPIDITV